MYIYMQTHKCIYTIYPSLNVAIVAQPGAVQSIYMQIRKCICTIYLSLNLSIYLSDKHIWSPINSLSWPCAGSHLWSWSLGGALEVTTALSLALSLSFSLSLFLSLQIYVYIHLSSNLSIYLIYIYIESYQLACAGGLKRSDINQSIQMDRLIDINLDIEGLTLIQRRSRRRPRGALSTR